MRAVMLSSLGGTEPAPGPWRDTAVQILRTRLVDPDGALAAFVVDAPDRDAPDRDAPDRDAPDGDGQGRPASLAACVVGLVEQRLPSPANPTGEVGYVFSVATDPDHRRRGYARACMQRLLAWFSHRGVTQIDLRASTDGEPMYRSLGFERTRDPAMRLVLPPSGG
nr:GNAT family N-acetyltransferase [Planosporangium thailandense]